jgi:hypothetical protein
MSSPFVLVPKHGSKPGEGYSKREILFGSIHPGRRTTAKGHQSPASWILDLIELRKPVILCGFCQHEFDPRHFRYRKFFCPDPSGTTSGYITNGKCAACKGETMHVSPGGVMFVAEEVYGLICIDPQEARRNARAAWKKRSPWHHIQGENR